MKKQLIFLISILFLVSIILFQGTLLPAMGGNYVVIPTGSADMDLKFKVSPPSSVTPGETFDFQIEYVNLGPDMTQNYQIITELSSGLQFDETYFSNARNYTGNTLTEDKGNLVPNVVSTPGYRIIVNEEATGSQEIAVQISNVLPYDKNQDNNQISSTIQVSIPDIGDVWNYLIFVNPKITDSGNQINTIKVDLDYNIEAQLDPNHSGGDFTFRVITRLDSDSSISTDSWYSQSVKAGRDWYPSLAFTPKYSGAYTATLYLLDNMTDKNELAIPLSLKFIVEPSYPALEDSDDDGVINRDDNCELVPNPYQKDIDGDRIGDACDTTNDPDEDKDGIPDSEDNCIDYPNANQLDTDGDGLGDACDTTNDPDEDKDGIPDSEDNCIDYPNANQLDTDGDGLGDACDITPLGADSDNDGIPDSEDNCPTRNNISQLDTDGDGLGDICDSTPNGPDSDGDGIADVSDMCPSQRETFNDFEDSDGCPDELEIKNNAEFDSNFRSSEPVRRTVIEDLTGYPSSEKNPDPKLDTNLYLIQKASNPEEFARQNGLEVQDDKIKILVSLEEELYSDDLASLESLGSITLRGNNQFQMEVPLNNLAEISKNPAVKSIYPPTNIIQNQIISEGLEFINIDDTQSDNSLTGQGIKIAVLDLAFDVDNIEIKESISEAKSFRVGFGKKIVPVTGTGWDHVHGTAVAEIIHDIAPNAKIFLYTFGSELEFTKAVDYAKSKTDMIAMSAGWINYPTDKSSFMTKTVESVTQSGIPFVISAGNYAQTHWEGNFNDENSNNWVDTGMDDDGFTINVGDERIKMQKPILAYLMWENQGNTISDFDLILWGPNDEIVAHSSNVQDNTKVRPYENIKFVPNIAGQYYLGIYYETKTPEATLEIFTPYDDLERPVEFGSVGVPTDAAGVISVGALDHLTGKLQPYSSWGPTNAKTQAPIVMAPDNVSTLAYGDIPFQGTSAAAPHVAGLVALMLEKNNELTTDEIKFGLEIFSDKSILSKYNNNTDAVGSGKADAKFLLDSDIDLKNINPQEKEEFEESMEVKTIPLDNTEPSQPEQQTVSSTSDGGGCLIATATYGSELAPQVQQLRELRDNKLLQTESGSAFMESFNDFYYSFSPIIADFERENPVFREGVKIAITPMISSLSILNNVDMETEAEVLSYGISLILLNIGMYVGVPVAVVIGIRKRF